MPTASLVAGVTEALNAQFAMFAALLLLATASHKIIQWSHLQRVTSLFVGIPAAAATPALAAAVGAEAAAGLLLCIPATRFFGAVIAFILWSAYLLLILRAVLQGRRDAECGCSFGQTHGRLGAYQIGRNLTLMGLSAFIALASMRGSGLGVRGSELVAALSLLTLYGALDQVMALRPMRSGALL